MSFLKEERNVAELRLRKAIFCASRRRPHIGQAKRNERVVRERGEDWIVPVT